MKKVTFSFTQAYRSLTFRGRNKQRKKGRIDYNVDLATAAKIKLTLRRV